MTSIIECDPSLFGEWPERYVYAPDAALETKAVPQHAGTENGPDELWRLLNDMTAEMREQFRFFRELREGAGAALDGAADEAAGKMARADVKAATDAISLIVRTLEKIDTLQRQLARDREAAAESEAEAKSYEDAVAFFEKRIEQLAEQKLRARLLAAGQSDSGSVLPQAESEPGV